jgi:hypothetical protein
VTTTNRLRILGLLTPAMVFAGPNVTPTFTRDVFPILQKTCVQCHRPGEMAPMPLTTYKEVRPWAAAIRETVLLRKMPPWYAEAPPGHFANDWRLTDAEVSTISRWIDAHTPEGDLADMPPARHFADGWLNGQPNLVLAIPKPVQIPASGNDLHPSFVFEHDFDQDTWVSGFEIRPDVRKIVHHANLNVVIPEPGKTVDWNTLQEKGERKEDRNFTIKSIHVGVPGRYAFQTAKGVAVLLPKGSRLRIDLHYVAYGQPVVEQTKVGLYFAEGHIDQERRNYNFQYKALRIPPNTPDYYCAGTKTVPEPVTVQQVACHMHVRGRSYRIWAELPDGREVELMNVPHYNFLWQQQYELAEPVHLPKGSILHYEAHYDNSRSNSLLMQYDTPDREVVWAERTIDEMMGGHVLHTVDSQRLDLTIDGRTGHVVSTQIAGATQNRAR